MNYQAGYLYLFGMLCDLIKQLDGIDPERELIDVATLLRMAQVEAEKRCIE